MMKNLRQAAVQPNPTVHFGSRSFGWIACGLALALALVVSAVPAHANDLYWADGNGDFGTAANWSPAVAPTQGDATFFTNSSSAYTVSFAANFPNMATSTFSGQTAVVTLDVGNFVWTITNQLRIGTGNSSATVYIAGGTIDFSNGAANDQLRIGDGGDGTTTCMGALFITNGLVRGTTVNIGSSTNGVGKLVVYGSGVYTNDRFGVDGTITVGNGSYVGSNQIIVTNGGKMFMSGELRVGATGQSNNLVLVSDPTSFLSVGGIVGGVRVGSGSTRGNMLIVSNGAKLFTSNGGTIGGNGNNAFNTGIVVGAGSAWLPQTGGGTGNVNITIGTNTGGGTNNTLIVYDGGSITENGTLLIGNGGTSPSNSFHMGGTGLMSTGTATYLRFANTSIFGDITITNAYFTSSLLLFGNSSNSLSVLNNGTLVMTGIAAPTNTIQLSGLDDSLIINGGQLISTSGSSSGYGLDMNTNVLMVTGGGKLVTDLGTIGGGSAYGTATVTGVSSVWSNLLTSFVVGTGIHGDSNQLSVLNGGVFYNGGTVSVGNSPTSTVNSVIIGGVGSGISTAIVVGPVRVGSSAGADFNMLLVTNGVLNAGTIVVGADANSTVTSGTNNVFEFDSGTVTVANTLQVRGTNSMVYNGGALGFNTLRVDGRMIGSAALTIPSGSTLGGVGSVSNPVSVADGGTISPGDSVGTLTISNNLVLSTASILNYEMGSIGNADKLTVVGNLTLDGVLNVTTNNTDGLFGAGNYTIITYTGSLTDNTLSQGTLPAGFTYSIVAGGGTVVLQVSSSGPSYSTWATYYGLSGGSALGTADPDGDGMNNTNEFLAGFNPTNSAAYVHVLSIAKASTTNIVVTYLGASGDTGYSGAPTSRTNVLEVSTGTGNGSYTNNFTPVGAGGTNILSGGSGLGTVASFIVTNGASSTTQYYRVRVLVP